MNCLASVEKARKVAEDKNYTSCDESQLGKGCRNKIPKQIYSNSDEENKENKDKKAQKIKRKRNSNCIISDSSDSDNNNNKTRKSGKKVLELPPYPNIENQTELLSHVNPSTSNENNDNGKYIVKTTKKLYYYTYCDRIIVHIIIIHLYILIYIYI